jgi:uncharacterized protein (UPF0333 family)
MTTNSKNIWIVAIVLAVIGAFYLGKHSTVGDHIAMNSSTTETTSDTTDTSTSSANGATPTKPSTSVKPTGGTVLTSGNTKGFHSTTDSTYHFTVQYPPTAQPRNTFTTFHELGNNWRLFAGPANQGKALLEISLHSIDQGSYSTGKQTYPLYFTSTFLCFYSLAKKAHQDRGRQDIERYRTCCRNSITIVDSYYYSFKQCQLAVRLKLLIQ